MTKHAHKFVYPEADGPTSTGYCACGSADTSRNSLTNEEFNFTIVRRTYETDNQRAYEDNVRAARRAGDTW